MFAVHIADIKKVCPEFKPSNIEYIRLNYLLTNSQRVDILHVYTGLPQTVKIIQITNEDIILFNSEFGFLAVEDEILATYQCYNKYIGDYSFSLLRT